MQWPAIITLLLIQQQAAAQSPTVPPNDNEVKLIPTRESDNLPLTQTSRSLATVISEEHRRSASPRFQPSSVDTSDWIPALVRSRSSLESSRNEVKKKKTDKSLRETSSSFRVFSDIGEDISGESTNDVPVDADDSDLKLKKSSETRVEDKGADISAMIIDFGSSLSINGASPTVNRNEPSTENGDSNPISQAEIQYTENSSSSPQKIESKDATMMAFQKYNDFVNQQQREPSSSKINFSRNQIPNKTESTVQNDAEPSRQKSYLHQDDEYFVGMRYPKFVRRIGKGDAFNTVYDTFAYGHSKNEKHDDGFIKLWHDVYSAPINNQNKYKNNLKEIANHKNSIYHEQPSPARFSQPAIESQLEQYGKSSYDKSLNNIISPDNEIKNKKSHEQVIWDDIATNNDNNYNRVSGINQNNNIKYDNILNNGVNWNDIVQNNNIVYKGIQTQMIQPVNNNQREIQSALNKNNFKDEMRNVFNNERKNTHFIDNKSREIQRAPNQNTFGNEENNLDIIELDPLRDHIPNQILSYMKSVIDNNTSISPRFASGSHTYSSAASNLRPFKSISDMNRFTDTRSTGRPFLLQGTTFQSPKTRDILNHSGKQLGMEFSPTEVNDVIFNPGENPRKSHFKSAFEKSNTKVFRLIAKEIKLDDDTTIDEENNNSRDEQESKKQPVNDNSADTMVVPTIDISRSQEDISVNLISKENTPIELSSQRSDLQIDPVVSQLMPPHEDPLIRDHRHTTVNHFNPHMIHNGEPIQGHIHFNDLNQMRQPHKTNNNPRIKRRRKTFAQRFVEYFLGERKPRGRQSMQRKKENQEPQPKPKKVSSNQGKSTDQSEDTEESEQYRGDLLTAVSVAAAGALTSLALYSVNIPLLGRTGSILLDPENSLIDATYEFLMQSLDKSRIESRQDNDLTNDIGGEIECRTNGIACYIYPIYKSFIQSEIHYENMESMLTTLYRIASFLFKDKV